MIIAIVVRDKSYYITTCPTGVFVDSTGLIVGRDGMQITTGKSLKVS